MSSIVPTAMPPPDPPAFVRRGRAWRWSRGATIAVAMLLLAAFVLDRLFPLRLPPPDTGSTVVLARDGTPLRAFADSDGVWRYPVTAKQVSPLYLAALLHYEDRWFYRHPGINPYALARGLAGGLRHGHIVSGGSTLTMQVARIIQPIPHTFGGKLVQILRALQLEAHLSKAQILDLYLNHAPFGGPIEGVDAASWAYLGKPASQLSRAEAALLAVLPRSPSRLRPDRHPEAARAARDKVLRRMRDLGVWSAAQVRDAAASAPTDVDAALQVADLDLSGGHIDDAFGRLLELFPAADQASKDAIRERLLDYFEIVGVADARVIRARGRLASLLY